MARWKARVKFLLTVIELLFLSLAVEALQGKMCQNSLFQEEVDHLEPRFQEDGLKIGGHAPNTMSSGPRPTYVPSGILIHLAIWPQ